jgi:hypothetical protein
MGLAFFCLKTVGVGFARLKIKTGEWRHHEACIEAKQSCEDAAPETIR